MNETDHLAWRRKRSNLMLGTTILILTVLSLIPFRETSWGFSCPNGMTVSALRSVTLMEAVIGKGAFSALLWNPEEPEC